MQLLLLLLRLLTAIKLFEAHLVRQRSTDPNPKMQDCISRLHLQGVNLTKVVECMARSANRTAFLEDTLWKLDLLERRLLRLEAMDAGEVYVPTPYVSIDDVLKIEGSVAGFDCQAKQHVVQAIRRKLEQVHMQNGMESTLFRWPFTKMREAKDLTKEPILMGGTAIDDFPDNEINEIGCLIRRAVERRTKALPAEAIEENKNSKH
ncbi:uncharacterized protein LOC135438121 [Drosophila montana]|uniref:uncharacterized protein LOC135438121 n=1 Tax=Drosophila montana TaxID=40370 RepID=UPI00313DA99B